MRCLSCKYGLKNLPGPEHRCPECGQAFNPSNRSTFDADDLPTQLRFRIIFVILAAVFLLPLAAGELTGQDVAVFRAFEITIVLGPVAVLVYLAGLAIWQALQTRT